LAASSSRRPIPAIRGHANGRSTCASWRSGEQEQIGGLLQSIHALLASAPQSQAGIGGLLGGLLNSNFGRAFENGAGFGLGTSLINKIL
jgi:hypothetical protein